MIWAVHVSLAPSWFDPDLTLGDRRFGQVTEALVDVGA